MILSDLVYSVVIGTSLMPNRNAMSPFVIVCEPAVSVVVYDDTFVNASTVPLILLLPSTFKEAVPPFAK